MNILNLLTEQEIKDVTLGLNNAIELLEKMTKEGLFSALEKGIFADIKRPFDGGKGLAGVFEKGENYYKTKHHFLIEMMFFFYIYI